MFNKTLIPHQHVGNKIIRTDTLEDYDGTQYTQTEVDSFLVIEQENELSRNELQNINLHAEVVDVDNNGVFVTVKRAGSLEDIQIG